MKTVAAVAFLAIVTVGFHTNAHAPKVSSDRQTDALVHFATKSGTIEGVHELCGNTALAADYRVAWLTTLYQLSLPVRLERAVQDMISQSRSMVHTIFDERKFCNESKIQSLTEEFKSSQCFLVEFFEVNLYFREYC